MIVTDNLKYLLKEECKKTLQSSLVLLLKNASLITSCKKLSEYLMQKQLITLPEGLAFAKEYIFNPSLEEVSEDLKKTQFIQSWLKIVLVINCILAPSIIITQHPIISRYRDIKFIQKEDCSTIRLIILDVLKDCILNSSPIKEYLDTQSLAYFTDEDVELIQNEQLIKHGFVCIEIKEEFKKIFTYSSIENSVSSIDENPTKKIKMH